MLPSHSIHLFWHVLSNVPKQIWPSCQWAAVMIRPWSTYLQFYILWIVDIRKFDKSTTQKTKRHSDKTEFNLLSKPPPDLIKKNTLKNVKTKCISPSLCFHSNHMTKMEHNTKERSNINEHLNINQHKPEWQLQSHHATYRGIIILTMTSWILPPDSLRQEMRQF